MRDYLKSERGAVAGEYALLLAAFGASVAVAAIAFSESISNSIEQSADLFASSGPAHGNGKGNHGNGKGNGGGDGSNNP